MPKKYIKEKERQPQLTPQKAQTPIVATQNRTIWIMASSNTTIYHRLEFAFLSNSAAIDSMRKKGMIPLHKRKDHYPKKLFGFV